MKINGTPPTRAWLFRRVFPGDNPETCQVQDYAVQADTFKAAIISLERVFNYPGEMTEAFLAQRRCYPGQVRQATLAEVERARTSAINGGRDWWLEGKTDRFVVPRQLGDTQNLSLTQDPSDGVTQDD